jgi:hypothetical protein
MVYLTDGFITDTVHVSADNAITRYQPASLGFRRHLVLLVGCPFSSSNKCWKVDMPKFIELIFDPKEETKEAFEARVAEAIAATGEPTENVRVIVNEIVDWQRPTPIHCAVSALNWVQISCFVAQEHASQYVRVAWVPGGPRQCFGNRIARGAPCPLSGSLAGGKKNRGV